MICLSLRSENEAYELLQLLPPYLQAGIDWGIEGNKLYSDSGVGGISLKKKNCTQNHKYQTRYQNESDLEQEKIPQ